MQEITDELDEVNSCGRQIVHEFGSMSEDERAVNMMHLFMFDLLGKNAESKKVLKAKLNEE